MPSKKSAPLDHSPRWRFTLAELLQLTALAAGACGVVAASDPEWCVRLAAAEAVAIWLVVGRWSLRLSPDASHKALAALATGLMFLAALAALLAFNGGLTWKALQRSLFCCFCGLITFVAPILCLVVYMIWLGLFGSWDKLAEQTAADGHRQIRLAILFSPILAVMTLPGMCALPVAAAVTSIVVLALLNVACWRSSEPPPTWMKLLTWGYLNVTSFLWLLTVARTQTR